MSSSSFSQQSAKLVSGLFIGLIVISFLFTFDSSLNTGVNTNIGSVGSEKIEFSEYEREYNFQLRLLSFQTGGKQLTSEQIELFRVKEKAFESLIGKKLLQVFANDEGLIPGESSIRENIKGQSFFQTNEKFDLVKYKSLLENNRLTPADYEELTKKGIQVEKTQGLLQTNLISKSAAKDLIALKEKKAKVTAVQLRKRDFQQFVDVNDEEINAYLADSTKKELVAKEFTNRKGSLDKPAEVKARHILIKGENAEKRIRDLKKKVNVGNFAAIAKENSEGPSKTKGGDLGWFKKGRMVKEFEDAAFSMSKGSISEPVKTQFGYHLIFVENKKDAIEAKIEDHEKKIAKELIQKDKKDQTESLWKSVTEEFSNNTNRSNWDKLAKKYNITPYYEIVINRLEPRAGIILIKGDDAEKFFAAKKGEKILMNDAAKNTILLRGDNVEAKKITDADITRERNNLARTVTNDLTEKMIESLWAKYGVSCGKRTINSKEDIVNCGL